MYRSIMSHVELLLMRQDAHIWEVETAQLEVSELLCVCMCVCVLQMRVARLEQLEKELQEARGTQESQLQVRHIQYMHTRSAYSI